MSERMKQIPFDSLIERILKEYEKTGTIFGIHKSKFYEISSGKKTELFGQGIETLIGPAAGPHTQLAQNIISAYLCGARFFELKTVQTLDGPNLPVSKPCINAADEGFNVEWSTELYVEQAFEEYVKGYFAICLLAKELGLGNPDGFIFNMSVGYDYEGITSKKIDGFIEGLKNAADTDIFKKCKKYLKENADKFQNANEEYIESIPANICRSITLSTLHGCPAGEIEKIADYLIREKRLNTFIKLNPTILGYETAKELCGKMGYTHLSFDDHHFKNDLQFTDAVPMLTRLKKTADDLGLSFGVKLTNTFPVKTIPLNGAGAQCAPLLPGEEMYMSGRSLYPLSINAAYKLAKAFNGDLRISFSGGADYFNIRSILEAGIYPITVATTLLKPGGYGRIKQLADELNKSEFAPSGKIDLEKLRILATEIPANHIKSYRFAKNRKLDEKVPLTDCFIAPCKQGCPIHQDIPEYVRLAGNGKYLEALTVITERNPMPHITGEICAHPCMSKCTRIDYDEPVNIRGEKSLAAEKGYDEFMAGIKPVQKNGIKTAIVGAGPCGLSAAYFLSKNGYDVTVFDKRDKPGGVVANVIPSFRISGDLIEKDINLIQKYGSSFVYNAENLTADKLFAEGYKHILLAVGCGKESRLSLEKSDAEPLNAIKFLESLKTNDKLNIGKNVAVIGAGNSAMDAARAAVRISGVENVYIVYRRTLEFAPADREEIELAKRDGAKFYELLSPVSHISGVLECQVMELSDADASGRRSPIPVSGKLESLKVDSIIAALGEKTDDKRLTDFGVKAETGKDGLYETNVENVFIGGDAARGPSTIVEAIADGMKFAEEVMRRNGSELKLKSFENRQDADCCGIEDKKAVLKNTLCKGEEHDRCLECNYVCGVCAEVCPNRANILIEVAGLDVPQIVHLDPLCNECGNCAAFCPYDSAPYKEKLTYFDCAEDFEDSTQSGFVRLENGKIKVRLDGTESVFELNDGLDSVPDDILAVIRAFVGEYLHSR